jgi:hypothetical protein
MGGDCGATRSPRRHGATGSGLGPSDRDRPLHRYCSAGSTKRQAIGQRQFSFATETFYSIGLTALLEPRPYPSSQYAGVEAGGCSTTGALAALQRSELLRIVLPN